MSSIADIIKVGLEAIAEEKLLVIEADSASVGDEIRADIPNAEKLPFLLVKGHGARRIRIKALVGEVEA